MSLFDPYGRPMPQISPARRMRAHTNFGFFEGGQVWGKYDDTDLWVTGQGAVDTSKALSPGQWRQLMSASRFLFANSPIVRGALLEQAQFSFPLTPQFQGSDQEFGREAEAWLREWRRIQNIRGPAFSQTDASRMRLIGRKLDGDIATVLTKHPKSDFPAIQLIRAHRIGSRHMFSEPQQIKTGPWRGFWEQNGIILNDQARPVAYRITGKTEAEDLIVSAANLHLSFRPDYPDQIRGISEVCGSISTWNDVKRLREYEMRAQMLQASLSVIERNEDGEAPPGSEGIIEDEPANEADERALTVQSYQGGLTKYFRSTTPGAGLELLRPDRPGADAQNFEDRIIASALYGMEWDPNFSMAFKEPGGAWARTIIQKIRRAVANNQEVEAQAQRRETGYAIAWAIKNGQLPRPKDGDWFSWTFQPPRQITADTGNDAKAKRDGYLLGTQTLQGLAGEDGMDWRDLRSQREETARDLLARAKDLQRDFPELSFAEAMALLEQRTPNGPPQQPQSPQSTEP